MDSRNLLSIWFGENRSFSIRKYRDKGTFSKRRLGPRRFAIDTPTKISFIFENYSPKYENEV